MRMQQLLRFCFARLETCFRRFSLIGRGPLWHSQELPWLVDLENQHKAILRELERYAASGNVFIDKGELSPGLALQYGTARWEFLHLMVYRKRIDVVAKHFPRTLEATKCVPGLCGLMFSRLPPERSEIPSHRDDENGTLRL